MAIAQKYVVEGIGWTGALCSLSAYAGNSLGAIASQSVTYLLLNIIGCACLIFYAVSKKAHASWVLNSIWLLFTAIALLRVWNGS
ncbi:hypothetical protein EPD60_03240 [Flaviaesturariibacter flavus]|uniref:CBU-0592-like domain-containing protein n=1 Tax=Flaviaesturariibacter flavus TaxID=2502780 RepID=A0A4R1BN64_9BACT|nr:hypothetical protein [Flaviaesturariibacter flavus]TCJ18788.1 hypothetical protein EPD60_03240 [Flaviaesturariibacter flavus]